jgi:hypothetical protein
VRKVALNDTIVDTMSADLDKRVAPLYTLASLNSTTFKSSDLRSRMEGRDDECSAVGGTRAWRTRAAQVLAAVLARQLLREFCHSSHVKRINYAHPTLNSLEASFAYLPAALPSLPRAFPLSSMLCVFVCGSVRLLGHTGLGLCPVICVSFVVFVRGHHHASSLSIFAIVPLLTIAHQLSNPCYACCMTQSPRPVSVRFDFPLRPNIRQGFASQVHNI